MSKRASYGAAQAFIREAMKADTDDCVLWPYGKLSNGYGRVKVNGVTHLAHRLVCAWRNGAPPTIQHEAAHSCGSRLCVNPAHVRWATPVENAADRLLHGTDARGERNTSAKLAASDVREIVASQETGVSLAARFGVSSPTITLIRQGRRWGHLEPA